MGLIPTDPDQPAAIHWIYLLVLTVVEPLLATGGFIQLYVAPTEYVKFTNPQSWHLFRAPEQQSLLTQISGGWFIIIINDLFLLRRYPNDTTLWSHILTAHLGSDLLYCYAVIQDIGLNQFFNPMVWEPVDWLVQGTTLPPLILKVMFLLGVGVTATGGARRRGVKGE